MTNENMNEEFKRAALTSCALKAVLREGVAYFSLTPFEREAVDAIALNLAYIVCGGGGGTHWQGVENYATMVMQMHPMYVVPPLVTTEPVKND